MHAQTPLVEVDGRPGHGIVQLYDPAQPGATIRLDTDAWWRWLDDATTRRFAYAIVDWERGYISGVMTVRKERRQRGGWYWTVYRRCGRRVQKVYLGRSASVTSARLAAVAWALLCAARAHHGEAPPDVPAS